MPGQSRGNVRPGFSAIFCFSKKVAYFYVERREGPVIDGFCWEKEPQTIWKRDALPLSVVGVP